MKGKAFCERAVAYVKAEVSEPASILLSEDESPVMCGVTNGLLCAYVVDEGDRFEFIQNRHLRSEGISARELHEIGVKNLNSMAEERVEVRPFGSIYVATMGGNFEASLILVPEFWGAWYGSLTPSGAEVAIPARDILAFGDRGSESTRAELESVCKRVRERNIDHPLLQGLLVNIDGEWKRIGAVA